MSPQPIKTLRRQTIWGLSFTVNPGTSITITQLGVYDVNAAGAVDTSILSGTDSSGITLGIFSNTLPNPLVGSSVVVTPTSVISQVNGNAFVTLATPIVLSPGSYIVDADNMQAAYNYAFIDPTLSTPHTTLNTGGGLISFNSTGTFFLGGSLRLSDDARSRNCRRVRRADVCFPCHGACSGALFVDVMRVRRRRLSPVRPAS